MVPWNPWASSSSSSSSSSGEASTSAAALKASEQEEQLHDRSARPPTHAALTPPSPPLQQPASSSPPAPAHDVIPPPTFLSTLSPGIPFASFSLGFVSGLITQSSRAGLVFMAENAHRRPDTVQGWYFYNKTKNYRVLLAGLKGGFALGTRLAAWTTLFVVLDGASAQGRRYLEEQDEKRPNSSPRSLGSLGRWTDGIVAGQGTALVASIVHRLAPGRLLLLGTLAGGTTGALQDLRDRIRPEADVEAQQ